MAPTSDDLHDLVNRLEARVKQLEDKLHEAAGGPPKPAGDSKGVRMVLIGPPGAGSSFQFRHLWRGQLVYRIPANIIV